VEPITIGVLGFLAGNTLGGLVGYLFGKSAAQQEIQQLQSMCQELMALNADREAEVIRVKTSIQELRDQIQEINSHRTGVFKFFAWIFAEFPEVVSLYRQIRKERSESQMLLQKVDSATNELNAAIGEKLAELQIKYPEEIAELLSAAEA